MFLGIGARITITMRLKHAIFCLMGCFIVSASCKKSGGDEVRAQARTSTLMEPHDTREEKSASSHEDKFSDPLEELDQVIKQLKMKTPITADTIDRLRSLINDVARREGCDPMCVAAKCIFGVDSRIDQLSVLGSVKFAFPDTPSKIALTSQLPAGVIRTSAVRGLCSNELKGDLIALQQLYAVMPHGLDRSLVATKAAEVVLAGQGVSAGLDYIAKLEMPEERYSALVMANQSDQQGWQEEPNIQKFHKIVDSLLPEHKKHF
jgi:hypothetical protein